MSNLLSGIPPAAGLIAQSSTSTASIATKSAEGNVPQSQAVQKAITSGALSNPAVVVSLSSDGKSRAASYGEGRAVDATFEKQASDEKVENSKDGKRTKNTAVNVTA